MKGTLLSVTLNVYIVVDGFLSRGLHLSRITAPTDGDAGHRHEHETQVRNPQGVVVPNSHPMTSAFARELFGHALRAIGGDDDVSLLVLTSSGVESDMVTLALVEDLARQHGANLADVKFVYVHAVENDYFVPMSYPHFVDAIHQRQPQ